MRNISIGSLYRHFKGNIYKVIDIVYDCESVGDNLEKVVIYEAQYGDKNKYPDVKQKYRFQEIKSVKKC